MRSMSLLQMAGGVAVAGVVAAGSTALTGTGLAWGGGAGGTAAQFVGGNVTQTVTGATVTGITYGYVASTGNTKVNLITIALTGTGGKSFTLATKDGSNTDLGYGGGSTDRWSCTDAGSADPTLTASIGTLTGVANNTVICEPSDGTTAGYYLDLSKVTVTIA
jgi:hypothetical protein